MMRKTISGLFLSILLTTAAHAADWVEGQHYFLIKPAQPVNVPAGKIEVIEVFSYGCTHCNLFYPTMEKLAASLPKNVQVSYLPAAFNPAEAWPMFQRAYLTAQAMGIADKSHGAMFNAIWVSDELAIEDHRTRQAKSPMPTIEKAAAFYARVAGVKAETFLTYAKSFPIELKIKNADAMVKAYRVDGTPTVIVQGKYRVTVQSAGGLAQTAEVVKFLVAKETK